MTIFRKIGHFLNETRHRISIRYRVFLFKFASVAS